MRELQSRRTSSYPSSRHQVAQVHTSNTADRYFAIVEDATSNPVAHKEQAKDPKLEKILNYLDKGLLPDSNQEAKKIIVQASQFAIVQNVLYVIDAS